MPNRNYEKGKRKEQRIAREAREKGLIAIRSAGSKSKVDVCIINLMLRRIDFIQCKPDDYSEKKTQELLDEMKELNGVFEVTFRVV